MTPTLPAPRLSLAVLLGSLLPAQSWFDAADRTHLPAYGRLCVAMATLDAEGDGDLDLVVGGDGPNELWLNDGAGAFAPAPAGWLPTTADATTAIAVGDVDGDGDDDMVWASAGTRAHLMLNTGGTFVDSTQGRWPALFGTTMALALGDVDGDGDLDVLLGGSSTQSRKLLENNGSGVFTDVSPGRIPPSSLNAFDSDLQLLDADGDGDSDLVVCDPNGGSRLFLNDGAGSFSPGAPLPAMGDAWAVAAGDVDGDGDEDLFFGLDDPVPGIRQDRLLINDGTGVFTDQTAGRVTAVDTYTAQVELIDLDADGDLDVVTRSARSSPLGPRSALVVWIGDGSGNFVDAPGRLPANDQEATALVPLDADGDGDPELAFATSTPSAELYWNDRGSFVPATGPRLPTRQSRTDGLHAVDLDGDGDLDLAAVGWNYAILQSRNRLFENDGAGGFREVAAVFDDGFYSSVVAGDVDGDGDADLVLGLDEGGQNQLWRNDGGWVFANVTTTHVPAIREFTNAVRLADFDGDGDLDWFSAVAGRSMLALNDGTGRFADATAAWIPMVGADSQDAAVGDVDGDGDVDVVVANRGGNFLWLNQGNRFADASSRLPTRVQNTQAVALADLDGDGDLDLILGNTGAYGGSGRSWVVANDGQGNFTAPPVPLADANVEDIGVGDFEGDGDLDVVLGVSGGAPIVYENFGAGGFREVVNAAPATVTSTAAVAFVDLDGDGDLDLAEGNRGADRVLLGVHRQLSSHRLAIPGGDLEFSLRARAVVPGFVPFAVLMAGVPATAPWPTPFGAARLDGSTLAVVAIVGVPAGGATWRMPVGTSPALLGVTGGFQALFVAGPGTVRWALSGLVLETVPR